MEIKFVSYDGEYPNLCRGKLVLNIDGKNYSFGFPRYINNELVRCDYDRFWESGGYIDSDRNDRLFAVCGDWVVNTNDLPDWLKPYADQLLDILNDNIEHGCCGGCI